MKLFSSLLAWIIIIFSSAVFANDFNLPNREWRLISLPAAPPAGENTVEKVFGDDIPGAYSTDWTLFEYDSGANQYRELNAADPVTQGRGYWIIQLSGNALVLDLPEGSRSAAPSIALVSSRNGSPQWNLAGSPFSETHTVGDFSVKVANGDICGDSGCSLDQAKDKQLVHNEVWTYNGHGYESKGIGDTLLPWEGFWIPALAGSVDYDLSLTADVLDNYIDDISASNDGEFLTLQMNGRFIVGSHFAFFIDADNNPDTGYTRGDIQGADNLAEGNGFFQYAGNGQDGQWNKISTNVSVDNTPTLATKRIPLSRLNAGSDTVRYIGYVATPDWKTKSIYPQMKEHKISDSQGAFTVSTFKNISLYWSPPSGSKSKKVFVVFKEAGENSWREGYPLEYNPLTEAEMRSKLASYEKLSAYDREQMYSTDINKLANSAYRGSIVQLKPDTVYEIQLTLEGTNTTATFQARTWSENFPIAKTVQTENSNAEYTINESGTEAGYILYDGTGVTIGGGINNIQIAKGIHHIIIRGFELENARVNGILLQGNNHHIVIENNNISQWGGRNRFDSRFGANNHAAIRASGEWAINDISTIIIQRNKIHDPNFTSNNWNQERTTSKGSKYHPWGPQALSLGDLTRGNLVIRNNEIWSDNGNCFDDAMGGGGNRGYTGFPGADSDIYGNYISDACDDAIEAEGNDINVRIWSNYITHSFLGVANAAVTVGPLYVWRNVFGEAKKTGKQGDHNERPGSYNYGGSIKGGESAFKPTSDGYTYLFNNTMLQENDGGFTGIGGVVGGYSGGAYVAHFVSRNNILQVNDGELSISSRQGNLDVSYDYDLLNGAYPNGQEVNGYKNVPTYQGLFFDEARKEGDFRLLPNSVGYDAGEIIPNFTDGFQGAAPDIGAHEDGVGFIVYGVRAPE